MDCLGLDGVALGIRVGENVTRFAEIFTSIFSTLLVFFFFFSKAYICPFEISKGYFVFCIYLFMSLCSFTVENHYINKCELFSF